MFLLAVTRSPLAADVSADLRVHRFSTPAGGALTAITDNFLASLSGGNDSFSLTESPLTANDKDGGSEAILSQINYEASPAPHLTIFKPSLSGRPIYYH